MDDSQHENIYISFLFTSISYFIIVNILFLLSPLRIVRHWEIFHNLVILIHQVQYFHAERGSDFSDLKVTVCRNAVVAITIQSVFGNVLS